MSERRATIADVARLAGVSPSTASLAFSGKGTVSDATRERVLDAAAALGYAGPDPRAASLRTGRSGIVGVVLEEHLRVAFLDPVKTAIMDGLTEGIAPLGAGILLLRDHGTWELDDVLSFAIGYARDGHPLLGRVGTTIAAVAPNSPTRYMIPKNGSKNRCSSTGGSPSMPIGLSIR